MIPAGRCGERTGREHGQNARRLSNGRDCANYLDGRKDEPMNPDKQDRPAAIEAAAVAPRVRAANYPESFAACRSLREKRALGDVFGLTSFGANPTRLFPGGESALRHSHSCRMNSFTFWRASRRLCWQARRSRGGRRGQLSQGRSQGNDGAGRALAFRSQGWATVLKEGSASCVDGPRLGRIFLRAAWALALMRPASHDEGACVKLLLHFDVPRILPLWRAIRASARK